MKQKFFIGDTHFHHANIIVYEAAARPFDTIEAHDEALIERWNAVVRPNDIVYHLGDFAFGAKGYLVATRLNGDKRLVLGNHDPGNRVAEMARHFSKIYGSTFIYVAGKKVLLTHAPAHPNQIGDRCLLNIHGHLHSKTLADRHYMNVSAEHTNLAPLPIEAVESRVRGVMK